LFPDTYFVDDSLDEKNFINQMRDNFKVKTKSLLAGLGKEKISEVVTIASILEEEGKTTESRKLIAGILYKRLAAGIALQVDATFIYVNGKQSKINFQDLAIDSPFNTYKYKGLPPHPITNPGLDSIKAALEPTSSPYLYYMSDFLCTSLPLFLTLPNETVRSAVNIPIIAITVNSSIRVKPLFLYFIFKAKCCCL
jgi:UPF0755 protein